MRLSPNQRRRQRQTASPWTMDRRGNGRRASERASETDRHLRPWAYAGGGLRAAPPQACIRNTGRRPYCPARGRRQRQKGGRKGGEGVAARGLPAAKRIVGGRTRGNYRIGPISSPKLEDDQINNRLQRFGTVASVRAVAKMRCPGGNLLQRARRWW
jgi:hypothetical protein